MIAPAAPTSSTNGNGQANGRPKQLGEISGRQGWPGGVGGYRGGWCGVPGGSVNNPLNFPAWGGEVDHYATALGWGGNYFVYRWILRHPMTQSVRGKVFNRAIASKWTIDAPNENVRQWFETALIAKREAYFAEALRALDYGHSCFEAVWEQDDDGYYCVHFKPLWVDWTTIAEDFGGGFLGLNVATRQDLTDAQRKALQAMTAPAAGDAPGLMRPNLPAAAFKSLLVTYDGEAGNLYGCPPLECLKDPVWKPWLSTAQQLVRLGGKLSERQAYAVVPPGGYDDSASPGGTRTFRDDAKDAVGMHARGECPILVKPMPDPGTTDAETVAAFGGKSFVEFGTVDYGSNASAVQYLTELLGYYDGLFFHAYQQSPRAGMESTHGSRADSEQHTETDTLFVERVARLMTSPVQPFVDEMARLNFGLKKGQVTLRQMDINDPLLQFKQSVYSALVTNTATGPTVSKGIGLTRLQNDVGVPVNTDLKPGDLEKMLVDDQQAAADAKAQATKAALVAKDGNAPSGTPAKSAAMSREPFSVAFARFEGPGHWVTIDGEHVYLPGAPGSKTDGRTVISTREFDKIHGEGAAAKAIAEHKAKGENGGMETPKAAGPQTHEWTTPKGNKIQVTHEGGEVKSVKVNGSEPSLVRLKYDAAGGKVIDAGTAYAIPPDIAGQIHVPVLQRPMRADTGNIGPTVAQDPAEHAAWRNTPGMIHHVEGGETVTHRPTDYDRGMAYKEIPTHKPGTILEKGIVTDKRLVGLEQPAGGQKVEYLLKPHTAESVTKLELNQKIDRIESLRGFLRSGNEEAGNSLSPSERAKVSAELESLKAEVGTRQRPDMIDSETAKKYRRA